MSEMLFEYKVRARHRLGWKEFSFYADTDIEEFLNRNSIDYVRNMTDTVEHRQLKEIERLKNINEEHRILNGEIRKELEVEKDISDGMLKTIDKAIEYIEIIQHNESYGVKEKDYLKLLDILKGSDKE